MILNIQSIPLLPCRVFQLYSFVAVSHSMAFLRRCWSSPRKNHAVAVCCVWHSSRAKTPATELQKTLILIFFFAAVGLPKESITPLLCVECGHGGMAKTPATALQENLLLLFYIHSPYTQPPSELAPIYRRFSTAEVATTNQRVGTNCPPVEIFIRTVYS